MGNYMSQVLELKRTAEGNLLARRKDRRPLTREDREEAKRLAEVVTLPRAWIAETVRDGETLRAVKICCAILEDHLWLIFDRAFQPKDDFAIYFVEELEYLKCKPIEELKS